MTAMLAVASLITPFEEDDPVLEQQVAQRHLPLPGVILVALDSGGRERMIEAVEAHGCDPLRDKDRAARARKGRGLDRPWPWKGGQMRRWFDSALADQVGSTGSGDGSSAAGSSSATVEADSSRVSTALSSTIGTSSTATNSRMRSIVLRSRICEDIASPSPSFSILARIRRGFSSVREAIASISKLDVVVLDLDVLRLGDLGQDEELLEAPESRLMGVGPEFGLPGADGAVAQGRPGEAPSPGDGGWSVSWRATRSARQLERRSRRTSWSRICLRTTCRFWVTHTAVRGCRWRASRRSSRFVEPDRVPEERGVHLGQAISLEVEDVES